MGETRKVSSLLVLLSFIVIIPFLSWLFLKQGFNYRLEALEQLKDSIAFEKTGVLTKVQYEDKVTLFALDGAVANNINGIYDQFKAVDAFQFINYTSEEITIPSPRSNYIVTQLDSTSRVLVKNVFGESTVFALVDSQGNIRRTYQSEDDMKELVKHVSTLLPFVEKKKKRGESDE